MPAARPAASLGELAQRAGLLDAAQLERFVAELRERVRAGRPASLARLLVERGLDGSRVRAACAAGAGAAVRCDACGTVHEPSAALSGREFPCTRCGALVVGLGALGASGERAPPPPARTPEITPGETTLGFDNVLPIPGARLLAGISPDAPADGRTVAFTNVLPTPGAPGDTPTDGRQTIAFSNVLSTPAPSEGRTTMKFANVLALPANAPAPAPAPIAAPPAPPFSSSPSSSGSGSTSIPFVPPPSDWAMNDAEGTTKIASGSQMGVNVPFGSAPVAAPPASAPFGELPGFGGAPLPSAPAPAVPLTPRTPNTPGGLFDSKMETVSDPDRKELAQALAPVDTAPGKKKPLAAGAPKKSSNAALFLILALVGLLALAALGGGAVLIFWHRGDKTADEKKPDTK